MPRKAGNPSTFTDNNITATPGELTALTVNMRKNFLADLDRPPVDLHNPKAVKEAIYNYLIDCEKAGKRPGNMGMYRALDMTRQDVNNVITGKSKSKVSPECIDILKKALQLLSEYREQLGAQGRLNPVTLLFWQKNYDNLSDVQQVHVTADTGPAANLTPDQIAKQIEKDIPLDADYTETDA